MTSKQEVQLRADLYKAVMAAIAKVGIGTLKATSMFASNRMAKPYNSDRVFDGVRPVSKPDSDRLRARYQDYARRVLKEVPKAEPKEKEKP